MPWCVLEADAICLHAPQESPHVLVVWRPDLEQYTAYVTREVPTSVPTTGGIMAMDLPKVLAQGVGLSLAAWQADIKVRCAGSDR